MSATVLVSYVPDEIDEADDDEDSGESLPSVFNVHNFQAVSCILLHICEYFVQGSKNPFL